MGYSRHPLPVKGKYLFGSILLLSICALGAAFGMSGGDEYSTARREIKLRNIGHELLLQSGDSTSSVLPVKKTGENEYEIAFQKNLTFLPDSLVNITRRSLANEPLAGDYVVNVLNGAKPGVTYGYAISKNKKDDIIPCKDRKQPGAPYTIRIKFKPAATITAKTRYLLGSLPLLALIGFLFVRSGRRVTDTTGENSPAGLITLGKVVFDAKSRQLIIAGNTTDLTGTETRLLRILASAPNQTIERNRLQKELWEDEGVIVGRSLDMFISKLRKKLEAEPDINIVVVRGKGYRLEVSG